MVKTRPGTNEKRMKKTIANTMTCSILASACVGLSGCSMFFWKKKEDPTIVPFATILSGTYPGFVKNWDERTQPVLCALMRSEQDWSYWFQTMPAKSKKQLKAPPAGFFDTQQLLLAARVMQAPDSAEREQVFKAEGVTYRNGVLRLDYEYKRPNSGATYQIKDYLLVAIPKERYTTGPVRFVENGKQVCELAR